MGKTDLLFEPFIHNVFRAVALDPSAEIKFMKLAAILIAVVVLTAAGQTRADILAGGSNWREIAFEVIDQRPVIDARVGEMPGRMMFDTGTPDAIFLNREALQLDGGKFVAQGNASSGQAIEVRVHDAPSVQLGGQPLATATRLRSGDFGFVETAFGADFLGFVGTPAVEGGAFVLDYGRRVLTVLRTDQDGALIVPAPATGDVLAHLTFVTPEGGLPTAAAFIGSLPIGLDFDTGDHGTLYLRAETQARLEAQGDLQAGEDSATLPAVSFGGATFPGVSFNLVRAGGPRDARPWPGSDSLRIGADFLSRHPSLWNFPAGTISILRPGSAFLVPR